MSSSLGQSRGFTLLEILVVVFLIGLMSTLLAPRVSLRSGLGSATSVLVSELRYTAQRATAAGQVHRLALDLPGQRFRIESRVPKEPELKPLPGSPGLLDLKPPVGLSAFEPIETQQGQWRKLKEEDVFFDSVQVGDQETTDDVAYIGFAGEGGADPAEIRLIDQDGNSQAIRVIAFTGEVRVLEPADE